MQLTAGADGGGRLQKAETGERGGRAELIARVAVAVEKCLERGVVAQERVEDRRGGERRAHRQVTAGQTLGHGHQVGRDGFFLTGKHRAGPAETGQHFVGQQKRAVAARDLRRPAQPAFRLRRHAGRALDQRLEDEGRVGRVRSANARIEQEHRADALLFHGLEVGGDALAAGGTVQPPPVGPGLN